MQGKTQIQIKIQSQIPLNEKIQFFDEEGVDTATLLSTTDAEVTETIEYVKLEDNTIARITVTRVFKKNYNKTELAITVAPVEEIIGSEDENFSWTEATEKPTLRQWVAKIIEEELER